MLKSKFIDIIKTFTPSELRQFRDFVRSPYHNRNKNVIKVFEYIKKCLPDTENEGALTKEKLFNKIYPRKKYNDLVLRILLSDLIKLSEEFLIIQGLKKHPHEEYQFLLQELNNREIDNLYGSISKEAFSLVKGYDDLRVKYLKLFEYEMNYIDHNLQRNKQQLITNNVLTRSEYLICFFIIELAGNIHDLIINENTFNAKFDFNLAYEFINRFDFNGLLKKLKESGSEHYTILLIYVNLIKSLLNESDDASYDEFKKSVFENYDKISRHEAYNLLNNLETCCLIRRKYNPGKYEEESYYVYALMLTKNNYSYYGEEMGLQRYKNILLNFINLGKFYEAEHFVKNYIEKVPVQIRENLHLYSLALLDFSRKNYFDALKMIQKIKYDYFTLKYDIKNLTLKIYYELKYYENAYSLIDSYRHFLLKNKSVSKFFRERYLNFISFTNALIRSSSDEKQFDADRIRIDLLKTQNVVSRDWLFEKLNELGTKR